MKQTRRINWLTCCSHTVAVAVLLQSAIALASDDQCGGDITKDIKISDKIYYGIGIADAEEGLMPGMHYSIFSVSSDAGCSWDIVERFKECGYPADIYFIDPKTGWIYACENILMTKNAKDFVVMGKSVFGMSTIYFVDEKRGWMANWPMKRKGRWWGIACDTRTGDCPPIVGVGWITEANTRVYSTNDSGRTWSPVTGATVRNFYGLPEKEFKEKFTWVEGKEIRDWLLKHSDIELSYPKMGTEKSPTLPSGTVPTTP